MSNVMLIFCSNQSTAVRCTKVCSACSCFLTVCYYLVLSKLLINANIAVVVR